MNVPVLVQTEYGNQNDSMIQWTRRKDKSWTFDFARLDRHLALQTKYCGDPKVINMVVMQGMRSTLQPPVPGRISYLDESTGKTALMDMDCKQPEAVAAWKAFAPALVAHLKGKGVDKALYWGHPLEHEADPELKNVLAAATPEIFWIAGPHEMMSNGTYGKNQKFYKVFESIRYFGQPFPAFRMDEGWRSPGLHLLNPRVGGTVFAMHTTSLPLRLSRDARSRPRLRPQRFYPRGRRRMGRHPL